MNIHTESNVITYTGCITQMYFSTLFGGCDNFLQAVVADEQFLVICHPLHYNVIMNPWLYGLLLLMSWI